MPPVLLSRSLDPILGVFTGFFAFYLYQTNPRTALPEDERLESLLKWKYTKWKHARELKQQVEEEAAKTTDK